MTTLTHTQTYSTAWHRVTDTWSVMMDNNIFYRLSLTEPEIDGHPGDLSQKDVPYLEKMLSGDVCGLKLRSDESIVTIELQGNIGKITTGGRYDIQTSITLPRPIVRQLLDEFIDTCRSEDEPLSVDMVGTDGMCQQVTIPSVFEPTPRATATVSSTTTF